MNLRLPNVIVLMHLSRNVDESDKWRLNDTFETSISACFVVFSPFIRHQYPPPWQGTGDSDMTVRMLRVKSWIAYYCRGIVITLLVGIYTTRKDSHYGMDDYVHIPCCDHGTFDIARSLFSCLESTLRCFFEFSISFVSNFHSKPESNRGT